MAAMVVLTFVDVVGRYVFARTLPGGYDVGARLQGFAIFWGIALACRSRTHISVDLLFEQLGPRHADWMQRFADACTALFFGAAAYAALAQLTKQVSSGERLAGVDAPAWPFYLAACLGLAFAGWAALRPVGTVVDGASEEPHA